MGMVKIDTHKGEYFYQYLTLSDPDVIKLLIKYRYKYDPYYMMEQERHFDMAGDVKPVNQEAIALYASLDEIIKKCRFKNRQLDLIRYVEMGYEFNEIEKRDKRFPRNSAGRAFNKVIKKIKEMNDYEWKLYIYKNKLNVEFKECPRCKRIMPKTTAFFGSNKNTKDKLQSICKKCDNLRKKV